ncbi:MAG TPA: DUF2961 domain-containing protein [Polyangiaceae bacterium]
MAVGKREPPVRYLVLGAGVLGSLFVLQAFSQDEHVRPDGSGHVQPDISTVVPREMPGEISVRSLLREMVDIGALARLPDPPYVARAASSYDRRSISPDDAEGWFANDDWASSTRPNYLRVEERSGRREYVLLDATGPGALVRIWSASPAGTLRFYFDGEPAPEIEVPFDTLLTGKGPIPDPFAYVAAKGFNAYFPLPFQKALKVTIDALVGKNPWQGGAFERIYYHLSFRSYARTVASRVRTYRRAELAAMLGDVESTARVFREPWRSYQPPAGSHAEPLRAEGDVLGVRLERPRGGAVRELALFVRDTSEAALQRATLELRFDGETTARVPLGVFFGGAPGLVAYDSLPFSVRADGSMICRFAMPFRERAEIALRGSPGAEGAVTVTDEPFTDRSLYFYARYRAPAVVDSQPPKDLRMIAIEGRGVYVGDVFGIRNPNDRWWGEGDEKIYVDGERFPSFFGTGTEDYYGYAWSTGELFFRALHAQTRAGGPGFSGTFSVNRFRTLDAVPFDESLRFDLELWHWGSTQVTWDGLIYYYARPGAKDDLGEEPDRRP